MTVIDKLIRGRIDEEGLRKVTAFVNAYTEEVREGHGDAINARVSLPLMWLIDLNDEFGRMLADTWVKDSHELQQQITDRNSGVLIRPVSYKKAKERLAQSSILDLNVPDPTADQIDVLAATHGGIWIVGVPINDKTRPKPKMGELVAVIEEHLAAPKQDVMLQAVVEPLRSTNEGILIKALAIPWFEILREIERDPDFLYRFAKYPRKFEEFIAATYSRAGWTNVELTPQCGDKGRDVIATKPGIGSIKFLDQCKAYSPGKLVTHDDVRAMYGVLSLSPNASKAIVTTTSAFAPGVLTSDEFKSVMPYRLELRDGESLRAWLKEIAKD